MPHLDEVSSLEEAAAYLKIEPAKLRRLALHKKIAYIRAGRQYLFPRDAIDAFVTENSVEAVPLQVNRYGLADSAYQRLLRQKRD
jgi:excisionase family DNA binding protein